VVLSTLAGLKNLPFRVVAILAMLWLGLPALPSALAQPADAPHPHFELGAETVLIDEVIPIVVSGLPPGRAVTVRLRGGTATTEWSSSATFTADPTGVVDLTRVSPIRGDYEGIDPMGLFWSARRDHEPAATRPSEAIAVNPPPEPWQLTAEVDGAIAATVTVLRRAVAADVKVTMVREHGLVGAFYQPSGEGRHPAVIVVSGSGGGLPPATSSPGGLASRGYAVLALAYFGVEGLPRSLHNIPLEYFGTAIDWLATQSSVDATRIGVLGTSRGGELALLLGSIYPQLRSVVAYVPSDVVWGGCCDMRNESSWTIGGRAVAWTSPARPNDLFARQQAAIRVERIHGAVLLISGRRDRVWTSTDMAERVMTRLRRNNFPYPFKHLAYDGAGHGIGRPYGSTMDINDVRHPLTGRIIDLGGTPASTARARADSWKEVLTFLDEHLRRPAASSQK
jgi:dienelactone hydrolase